MRCVHDRARHKNHHHQQTVVADHLANHVDGGGRQHVTKGDDQVGVEAVHQPAEEHRAHAQQAGFSDVDLRDVTPNVRVSLRNLHEMLSVRSHQISFLFGAMVTVLIALLVPEVWVEEYIFVGVAVSLTVTAVILSRLSGTRIWSTILRSLFIGVAALGTSVLVGSLLG